MRRLSLMLLLVAFGPWANAQYFQFSQYNFTKQRINPATAGLSDYASVSLLYRHQPTAGGFSLNSNFLDASYPLISKKKVRWAGIGLSFMDDRSGSAALFRTQEIGATFAGNIRIAKFQTLSLGTKILYQTKKIDLDGLFTGSQYIPDRGFDGAIANGETGNTLKTNYVSLNFGLHWERTDKKGNRIAYAGFSFFDFNKPQEDFLEANRLHQTWVGSAGMRVYSKNKISVTPQVLYTYNTRLSVFNVGIVTQYDLQTTGSYRDHLKIITSYVPGRSAILGLQLHRENFSVGLSYDMPAGNYRVANQGAIEIGIELRKLVKKSKVFSGRKIQSTRPTQVAVKERPIVKDSAESETPAPVTAIEVHTISERLRHKQDSIDALASAGEIRHEPLVLETAVFHFNFEFGSSDLDESLANYVQELAQALVDNPKLNVSIVGHTDNVGSDKFNLKLSLYRAAALKDALVENGVEASRIRVDGKGMREPLNNNRTEAERALNRRVVLTVLYD